MQKLFIIISHYYQLAKTIKEYLIKMMDIDENFIKIEAIGGINSGQEIGTEPMEILKIIENNDHINEIFIFSDLGSATLAASSIALMVNNKKIHVSKGAIVENCFAAYVLANSGAEFQDVVNASEEKLYK
ncbi:PTS-dependent dihydroxyacetone kinase phosphotransferase subunit DhaM [Mesomycoplasma lagogenitalium]|uniref:Dihydroxyacetone kinase n=1 Tax=Mesomycoplasma lagogenitalium TaxID=171286 RepID=A0ABY8LW06_9BACT|nr:dihydroxyacetone kinase [Mesomycoplasma lagogenitalium]WGI36990.1 dihydroxyacetone kinase [Mesomycoplasma lagogenitalium]